jgi:hypothetical protein
VALADNDTVRNAALTLKDVVVDILINSAGIAGVPQQSTGKIDYAAPGQRKSAPLALC